MDHSVSPPAFRECAGNGICVPVDSNSNDGEVTCQCNEGFEGDVCSVRKCGDGCQNKGTCGVDGKCTCQCDTEACFEGEFCEIETCPKNGENGGYCSGHGSCTGETGKQYCECETGYSRQACEIGCDEKFKCVKVCECNYCDGEGKCLDEPTPAPQQDVVQQSATVEYANECTLCCYTLAESGAVKGDDCQSKCQDCLSRNNLGEECEKFQACTASTQ